MKMVLIAYSEALHEEVLEALARCCSVVHYTVWTKVAGRGGHSEPHLMTHVWPKGNNVLMTCVDDSVARALMDHVRELRRSLGHEGIKAFLLPVEDVT